MTTSSERVMESPSTGGASSALDQSDATKKQTIKKTLAIAIPTILVVLAGVALIGTTVAILATKTSIFKPSAKIIQSCSNNILGSAQGAASSVNLEAISSINQSLLDESLLKMWSKIKLQLPNIEGLPNTADGIRSWLNNPSNKYLIESITELNFHGLDLKIVPPEIRNFTGVKDLWLSCNNLTFLPPEIGQLKKLEYLRLQGNKLISLPKEIGDCESLSRLYLRCNNLSSLPMEMEKLNLLSIDFGRNQFTAYPEVLKSLKPFKSDAYLVISFDNNPFVPFHKYKGELFYELKKLGDEIGLYVMIDSDCGNVVGFWTLKNPLIYP
ncbi:MAG: leucine-rich repeat domain-containing protein [Candidatus Thorarchaeota archaeon]